MQASYRIGFFAALLALGFTTYFSLVIFQDYPLSADEYNYWYQAQIFAMGKLSFPMNSALMPLDDIYMILQNNSIISKYSPGFSAVLTLGALAGVSGLINPIISACTILVLFTTLRSCVTAKAAATIILLTAVNSYFLGYGGSYFSQPLALFLTACSFYSFSRYTRDYAFRHLVLCGFVIACCFLVRPLDAFCLWLAMSSGAAIVFYRRRKNIHHIPLFSAIAFAGLLLLYCYNYWTVHCFCIAKYPIWNWEFKVVDSKSQTLGDNISRIAQEYGNSLLLYTWPNVRNHFITIIGVPFILMALAGGLLKRDILCLVGQIFTLLLMAFYNFHPTEGWPQYGARYWYPAMAPLVIMAAYGAQALMQHSKRSTFLGFILFTLGLQIVRLDSDMKIYANRFILLQSIRSDMEAHCPAQSIVIIPDVIPALEPLPPYLKIWDLRRNPFLKGPRLFVSDSFGARLVAPYFPNYTICDYLVRPQPQQK